MRRGGGRGRLDQHAIAARSKAPLWLVLWSTRVLEGMQCVRSGTAEYIREKQRRILRGQESYGRGGSSASAASTRTTDEPASECATTTKSEPSLCARGSGCASASGLRAARRARRRSVGGEWSGSGGGGGAGSSINGDGGSAASASMASRAARAAAAARCAAAASAASACVEIKILRRVRRPPRHRRDACSTAW